MRKVVYGILCGFLLVFLRAFPVQGADQGLSDASVAYADSVGLSLEKTLARQGYEPDGQRFAIQVSIALRYRLFQGESVGDPIRVLAIREGDPMTLMVSSGNEERDDETLAESSAVPVESPRGGTADGDDSLTASTESPKDESANASGSPEDEAGRVGRKIGESLAACGYTGAYGAISDQVTAYLKACPVSSREEAERLPIPVRIVRDGRLRTIEVSVLGIADGSFESSRIAKGISPKRKRDVVKASGRKAVPAKRIAVSVPKRHDAVAMKTRVPATRTGMTVGASSERGHPDRSGNDGTAVIRTASREKRTFPYCRPFRFLEVSEAAYLVPVTIRENILRLLSRHGRIFSGAVTNGSERLKRPPTASATRFATRSAVLRN